MDGRRRPTTSQARAMTSNRRSNMGGAPPLLAMNGRGYTVLHVLCKWTGSRGGGTWQWGRQGGATRALQVDRLQRRRDLADGCRANVSAQARPSQWDSIRLVIIYAVSKLWGSSRPSYTNCHGWSPQTATPPPHSYTYA